MHKHHTPRPQRTLLAGLALALTSLAHSTAGAAPNASAAQQQSLIQLAGQSHAMAEICGTSTASDLANNKAKLKTQLVAEGYNAASFDTEYEAVRTRLVADAKANPAKAQKSCEQLKAMGQQMEQLLKQQGAAGKP